MRLRRLELWWRRLWIKGLVRLMRRPPEAPRWNAHGPYRVLFLRHDRAGDMVLSTGVLRAIARSHPTITLDVLASPLNAPIIEGADYVGDTITFDKRAIGSYIPTALRLRRARYDAVVDCMVTAPSVTTLLLVLASGARHRIGIAGRGNDAAFTLTVPPDPRPGRPHGRPAFRARSSVRRRPRDDGPPAVARRSRDGSRSRRIDVGGARARRRARAREHLGGNVGANVARASGTSR